MMSVSYNMSIIAMAFVVSGHIQWNRPSKNLGNSEGRNVPRSCVAHGLQKQEAHARDTLPF